MCHRQSLQRRRNTFIFCGACALSHILTTAGRCRRILCNRCRRTRSPPLLPSLRSADREAWLSEREGWLAALARLQQYCAGQTATRVDAYADGVVRQLTAALPRYVTLRDGGAAVRALL
jgi:hypothetical protein